MALACLAAPAAARSWHISILNVQNGRAATTPYMRVRPSPGPPFLQRNAPGTFGAPQRRGGYQDPAYARGYSDGYRQGRDDGRDRDQYDPVGHREYRDGDQGYDGSYGSRDAYRDNYRAGYREGYEEGYRDGSGRRR
jgi:hypothetical protein